MPKAPQLIFDTDLLVDILAKESTDIPDITTILQRVATGKLEGWYAPCSLLQACNLLRADFAREAGCRRQPLRDSLCELGRTLKPLPQVGDEIIEVVGDKGDFAGLLLQRLALEYLPDPLLVTGNPEVLARQTPLRALSPESLLSQVTEEERPAAEVGAAPGDRSRLTPADRPPAYGTSDHAAPAYGAPPIAFIDLAAQQRRLEPEIRRGIHRVLGHGRYIMGPEVEELESRLADYVGVKHCVTVSSGTDSLIIAMMALGIGPGDEVITSPFTFIATGESIALLGARPVFVDILPRTFNLDPQKISPAISPRTRAIMPVSLYGQCADLSAINAVAARHGVPVIEDGAQSFGATTPEGNSCALTTIGSTSFFPSKPLGGYGDGGALFTNDDRLAQAMAEIRAHGQDRRYHHPRLGLNGRLDSLQAAVLLAKLDQFPWEVERRREIGARYHELIRARSLRIIPPHTAPGNTHLFAQYTIRSENREGLIQGLERAAIPFAIHYPLPLSRQPVFAALGYGAEDFPVAEAAAKSVLSLPMHPLLTPEEQERVVSALE